MGLLRFLVCFSLFFLLIGGSAPAADKGGKRLCLPWCESNNEFIFEVEAASKLPLFLSVPAKALDVDYPTFAAKKDKTPAERFIGEFFAAVADGTVGDKFLDGGEVFYAWLAKPEAKDSVIPGLRLECLTRFDGEYVLIYSRGRDDQGRFYNALHFRKDENGKWAVADDAAQFCVLLAQLYGAAIKRGEKDALFTLPETKFAAGVNHNQDQWALGVMTPNSEFKVHFNAKPLDLDFQRRGDPGQKDALVAAMHAHFATDKTRRFAHPLAVVDAGPLAWVIYDGRAAAYAGYRNGLQHMFFRKDEEGAWNPCPQPSLVKRAFALMAINVLNAVRVSAK